MTFDEFTRKIISEMADELRTKQKCLIFDNVPTENSVHPVTSDGIKKYVDDSKVSQDNKLSSDLVNDTDAVNKFFKRITSEDIFDSDINARNLNLMPANSIYFFSGGDIENAPKGATDYNAFCVICINTNSEANFPTNNYGAMQILVTVYGVIYTRHAWGWNFTEIYNNGWSPWLKGGIVAKKGDFHSKENMKGKTALMVGDSITDETYEQRWCTTFAAKAGLSSYTNVAESGSGWNDWGNGTKNVEAQIRNSPNGGAGFDYIFIASGNNDVASNIEINTFASNVQAAINYCITYTTAKIIIITPIKKASNGLEDEHTQFYRNVITNVALSCEALNSNRIRIIQGNLAPLGDDDYIPDSIQSQLFQDSTHPTTAGSIILGEYIYNNICLVEDTTKVDKLTPDWADQVYVLKTDGTSSSYYIDFNSTPYSVCIRNASGRLNVVEALYDSQAMNLGQYKNIRTKIHHILANVNDGTDNFKALITLLSHETLINTRALLYSYFSDATTGRGYNFANTTKYVLQNVQISKLNSAENGFVESSTGLTYDSSTQMFTSPNISNGAALTIVGVISDTVKAA